MNAFSHVPPGFRFHPTDEELVDYYLRRKITSRRFDLDVIKDVDLYKIEPWDLQELCKIGSEEQSEWYFFSHKDKKYPTGTRTNRATVAGFWKATGRDKAIYSKHDLIGMRKTLVFYKGRAPNGQKSDWIMHEYRLETNENATPQEEGWVVCRVFKKKIATSMRRVSEHESPCWYDDQVSFMPDLESPKQNNTSSNPNISYPQAFPSNIYLDNNCKKELDHHLPYHVPHDHFLPLLESPKLLLHTPPAAASSGASSMAAYSLVLNHAAALQSQLRQADHDHHQQIHQQSHMINNNINDDDDHHHQNFHAVVFGNNNSSIDHDHQAAMDDHELTDWRVLDKFVASQLSHEGVSKQNINNNNNNNNNDNNSFSSALIHGSNNVNANVIVRSWENKQGEMVPENASTSTSSCQIELWK